MAESEKVAVREKLILDNLSEAAGDPGAYCEVSDQPVAQAPPA